MSAERKEEKAKAALLPRSGPTASKSGCESLFHTSGVRVMQTKDKQLTEEKRSTSQRRTRTPRRQAGEQKGCENDGGLKGVFGSESRVAAFNP